MSPVNIHKAPRRKFMGFKVRVLRDLRNNGGATIKASAVAEIVGRWKGTFTLRFTQGTCCIYISGVNSGDFSVVP